MKWIVISIWALVAPALHAAGEEIRSEGEPSHLARAADGSVWGIRLEVGNEIQVLVDQYWQRHRLADMDAKSRPVALETFEDGDVGCLWMDGSKGEDHWLVTRHGHETLELFANFQAKLREPVLHGFKDRSVVITESGRTVVLVPPEGKIQVSMLSEQMFLPPDHKQEDGSLSKDHAPIHALHDSHGILWLWSPSWVRQTWMWRLNGLARIGPDKSATRFALGDTSPAITSVVPWDEKHLAVAAAGVGLLLLNTEGETKAERMPVPNVEGFKYIEQIFKDGDAWYVVTMPRPTETGVSISNTYPSVLFTRTTKFYDGSVPVCALVKYLDGKWSLTHDGLGMEPVTNRAWLPTTKGLLLASDKGPPWLFPNGGGVARRISPTKTYPLNETAQMFKANAEQLLLVGRYPDDKYFWPGDLPVFPDENLRWDSFTFQYQALQDAEGRIWGFNPNDTFVRWDGVAWKEFPPPPLPPADDEIIDFVLDDQNRAWLLSRDDGVTSVCELSSGEWTSFPAFRDALAAQLPKGVTLHTRRPDMWMPRFSGDGRIGMFIGKDTVALFEEGKWHQWKFNEIAGSSATIFTAPYFEKNGSFTLLVGDDRAWQWHGEKDGWKWNEEVERTRSDPDESSAPESESLGIQEGDVTAQDRYGIHWVRRKNGELFKRFQGREVKVFEPEEFDPFRLRDGLYRVLADNAGNTLLETHAGSEEYEYVFLRPKSPTPVTSAEIGEILDDTVRIKVGGKAGQPLWHAWRLDEGNWQPLSDKSELPLVGLGVGNHRVEVRAFHDDLTPSAQSVTLEFAIGDASKEQFSKFLEDLASPDLEVREIAARKLKGQGVAALPSIEAATAHATPEVKWWLQAIIQYINGQNRGETAPPDASK